MVDTSYVKDAAKLFSVPDFVDDACKAIASRVRGAVAGIQFDDFHKVSELSASLCVCVCKYLCLKRLSICWLLGLYQCTHRCIRLCTGLAACGPLYSMYVRMCMLESITCNKLHAYTQYFWHVHI